MLLTFLVATLSATDSMQTACMLRTFGTEDPPSPAFQTFMLPAHTGSFADVCSWRGVSCAIGEVKALAAVDSPGVPLLAIEWLPASTAVVHLRGIRLTAKFSTRMLPKGLQYLSMCYCHANGGPISGFDLQALPRKLTELHISRSVSGSIYIADLPPTLRLMSFLYNHIKTFYIASDGLPQGLTGAYILNKVCPTKLESADGGPIDDRFHIGHMPHPSNTMAKMEESANRIQHIIDWYG